MRRFWRWLCGYVCVCLNGKQLNRFLNLCSRNNIHLWHIYYDLEHKLRVKLRLKDFYILKPYLRKTKTKLRILSKHGFPFWCHRHPKLKWFFLICICVIGLFCYSLTFVWTINIQGNSKISTQEILDFLNEKEISVGQKSRTIDCTEIEYLIRAKYQEIGWVSVYVEHTSLNIEVKESLYDEHQEVESINSQYDLVANKDATIYSIITRSGTAIAKEGDRVKEGDTLVIGQCAIYDDVGEVKDVLLLKADAQIIADVTYEFTQPISEMEILTLKTSNLYSDEMLYFCANKKMNYIIDKLEQNGVIILDKNVMINVSENNISFTGKIWAREEIGINIPVEETLENEFE